MTKQSVSKVRLRRIETKEHPQPEQIIVRKIQFTNPQKSEKQIILYTTLLDSQKYPANDITALFQSRWQIELTFRDIKTIFYKNLTQRTQRIRNVRREPTGRY